jgi:hypothetical protein
LSPARARWSALFTEATLVSSSTAVSFAGHPSTSRRISTARGRGDRCWIATMNASSIVSRATTSTSAPSASSRSSGNGSSHGISPVGDGVRGRRSSASRHAFVAIRYSQARNEARPA